jgi:hypothetical protein
VRVLHPDLPHLIDAYLALHRRSWQQLERGEIKIDGKPLTSDDLQWWLINADPVLWVECNLVNQPEDGGGLWKLFDYQRPSLRYRGNVVHQDGAEVGKTRELVGLILWGALGIERGSTLVGAARDGDLDEIWEEIDLQLAANPYLRRRLKRTTTKPYRKLTWDNGLRTLFRPAGHDGTAFRGIHVRGWLLLDEAAKVAEAAWRDFWRAGKPGCEIRLYSVPTGVRLCSFQRIADNAVPAEHVLPAGTPRDILDQLLRPATPAAAGDPRGKREGRTFVRFHWPKTLMPHPYWSEERRRDYIEQFGGPDEPGYVHNVLGLPGDPEYTVFPDRLLAPALTLPADYRTLTLRWDTRAGTLDAQARRLNPSYPWGTQTAATDDDFIEATADAESDTADDSDPSDPTDPSAAIAPYLTVLQDTLDVSAWPGLSPGQRRDLIDRLASDFVRPLAGDLTAGVDVGSATVTEILVQRRSPLAAGALGVDTIVLRLSLIGWNWYAQRDLLLALDALLAPAGGWGVDATGVGRVLVDLLAPDFGDRLSGYVFNRATPALDPETGDVQLDPNSGQPVTVTYKELGTQLLERRLHGRRLEIPFDPEVRHLLSNHTYTQSGEARRYSKKDDHLVDALRVLELRKLTAAYADAAPPPVYAVPPANNNIDAAILLRDL